MGRPPVSVLVALSAVCLVLAAAVYGKHAITAKLRQIPSLGPIRSASAVALIQTPHRFRGKRQLWTYSGTSCKSLRIAASDVLRGIDYLLGRA